MALAGILAVAMAVRFVADYRAGRIQEQAVPGICDFTSLVAGLIPLAERADSPRGRS